MTAPATDAECLALQAHAIVTDDAFLRRLTYAALGHESRVAMMPLEPREIEVARVGVTDQLEMLRCQGVTLRTIGGES